MGGTAAAVPPLAVGEVQEDQSDGPPGGFSFPDFFLAAKRNRAAGGRPPNSGALAPEHETLPVLTPV